MGEDVYCKYCAHMEEKEKTGDDCSFPDNIKEIVSVESWYDKPKHPVYIAEPKDINENNDCKWYKYNNYWDSKWRPA